jgi:hypothetical protein
VPYGRGRPQARRLYASASGRGASGFALQALPAVATLLTVA